MRDRILTGTALLLVGAGLWTVGWLGGADWNGRYVLRLELSATSIPVSNSTEPVSEVTEVQWVRVVTETPEFTPTQTPTKSPVATNTVEPDCIPTEAVKGFPCKKHPPTEVIVPQTPLPICPDPSTATVESGVRCVWPR